MEIANFIPEFKDMQESWSGFYVVPSRACFVSQTPVPFALKALNPPEKNPPSMTPIRANMLAVSPACHGMCLPSSACAHLTKCHAI